MHADCRLAVVAAVILMAGCAPEPPVEGPFEMVLLETEAETSANASIADLDADGDLDIVLAKGRHWPLANRVLINDGQAHFTATDLGGPPDRTYSSVLADLDGDGDVDVVVSNDNPDEKLIYLNDGHGGFSSGGTWGNGSWATRNAAVADLNGDGFPDVIAANRMSPSFFCLNDRSGAFRLDSCVELPAESATSIVPGDFDGDGLIDLAVPHRDGGQSHVYFNQGQAVFSRTGAFGSDNSSARTAAAGDLDGDRRLDLVVGDDRRGAAIYFNSGGRLSEGVPLGDAALQPYSIAIADMNGDGVDDVVVGYVRAPGVVFLNDGTGLTFEAIRFGDSAGAAYGMALGDLDGDGDLDIAVGRSDAPNVMFLNGIR